MKRLLVRLCIALSLSSSFCFGESSLSLECQEMIRHVVGDFEKKAMKDFLLDIKGNKEVGLVFSGVHPLELLHFVLSDKDLRLTMRRLLNETVKSNLFLTFLKMEIYKPKNQPYLEDYILQLAWDFDLDEGVLWNLIREKNMRQLVVYLLDQSEGVYQLR